MFEDQRGLIQIPILVAMFVSAVFAGGAVYVAPKVFHSPSDNILPPAESEDSAILPKETETETKLGDEETAQSKTGERVRQKSLQQQIPLNEGNEPEITPEEINEQLTLPNGAIVEIDENGNILRYIREPDPKKSDGNDAVTKKETVNDEEPLNITNVDLLMEDLDTTRIEWQTSRPTEGKIFISGNKYPSQVFESNSGISTRHFVELSNFSLKDNIIYDYEIEIIDPKENEFAKKIGTFTLLKESYDNVLARIRSRIELNPQLTCKELFIIRDEYLVCLSYRAGL